MQPISGSGSRAGDLPPGSEFFYLRKGEAGRPGNLLVSPQPHLEHVPRGLPSALFKTALFAYGNALVPHVVVVQAP